MAAHYAAARPFRWLARKILFLFVRPRVLPEAIADLNLDPDVPVCYVLDLRSLSNALVVDEVCKRLGLPRPLRHADVGEGGRDAVVYLRELRGWFGRRIDPRLPPGLDAVYQRAHAGLDADISLVPVSVFFGRSPDKEDSKLKLLFSDSWAVVGRLRRIITIVLHGRQTLVQFSQPVSLRGVVEENPDEVLALRKLSRVLRVHFRRLRVATIGPDLSHRRNMVDSLLAAPAVRDEIANQARANGWPVERARAKARQYANEIAADYSYPVVRFSEFFLAWLWTKLYRGIEVKNFSLLQGVVPGNEIVYVPCHRSHIDYLLLSFLLYRRGLVPPHIAAGDNLNLPLLGGLLRRGGAFFLRRSFKGNRLYSKVFDAYLRRNLARGVSIEYFIEGTRSRTGRLLSHKAGLLAMTVQSYLRDQQRPIVFVPIYLGYERLVEGRTYLGELSGNAKRRESLWDLLRSVRVLREDFGTVHVNFGQPIVLHELLDQQVADWRDREYEEDSKPEFLKPVVDNLGAEILLRINRATAVSAVNLVALALLATPKQAMVEADLRRQIDMYIQLLARAPYSELATFPEMTGSEVIAYAEGLKLARRRPHALGDIIRFEGDNAVLMTYFRNNILHLVALPAIVACCFLDNRSMAADDVARLCALVRPYLEKELSMLLPGDQFAARVAEQIDVMVELGLLLRDEHSGRLRRPESRSFAAVQLSLLAQNILPALERYYLVIALLLKHGSGVIRQSDLERECQLMAERVSLLHELDAPEFFDRNLFRAFIDQLRESEVLWTDSLQRLTFDARIREVARDAQIVLSEQIRHSILQVTHS